MLGFVIVDRQPTADSTAVWLTCRVEDTRANHTNAVVIAHDDEKYARKIWALSGDRVVVLTGGSTSPYPFEHTRSIDVFDRLVDETLAHQLRITNAVAAARTAKRNLVMPDFPSEAPKFVIDKRDEPEFRALAVANYIAAVWGFWLATDEQRVRRTVNPKTGEPPGIMPEELSDLVLAQFPSEFGKLMKPEPLKLPPTS